MAEGKPKEFTPEGSANPETRGGKMGNAVWSEEYKAWMLPEVEIEGRGSADKYSGKGENPIVKTRNIIAGTMQSFYPVGSEESLDPAQQAHLDFLKRQQEMLDKVLGIAAIEARQMMVMPQDRLRRKMFSETNPVDTTPPPRPQAGTTTIGNAQPMLPYNQWGKPQPKYQKYYAGLEYDLYLLPDTDGERKWVATRITNAWYSKEFLWYNNHSKRWQAFVPFGYHDPEKVVKSLASATGEFGKQYEKLIQAAVFSMLGGAASGVGVGLARQYSVLLARSATQMAVEMMRQMAVEGKNLRTLQLDDIAAAGISPDLPKWVHAWLFESLKIVITDFVSLSASSAELNSSLSREAKVKTIVQGALSKYTQLSKEFFGKNDEAIAEIAGLYYAFISNSVIYEFFNKKENN